VAAGLAVWSVMRGPERKRSVLRAAAAPGFTLAAGAALSVGIGATTAIFSVVNTVLLKPVSFRELDRIVWLQVVIPQGRNQGGFAAKCAHWRKQTTVVQDVAAFRNGLVNYTGVTCLNSSSGRGGDRVRALPGVEHAAATCCVTLEGGFSLPFVVANRSLDDGPFHGWGGWTTVSDGFVEVFRIPTRRGRVFTERDNSVGTPVVVINETLAQEFWPDGDRLTDRITIRRGVMQEFADEPERQIIGVVADIRDAGLNSNPPPRM